MALNDPVRDVDLVVIGAGAAGLTAAAVAAGRGADVLVIEHLAAGGQVATVDRIVNMPGFAEGIGGFELGPMLQQQAEENGAGFVFDTVERVEAAPGGFVVACAENAVFARAVIVAAGSRRKSLGIDGEESFEGRGVSHCASCDGQFFRGKPVVVVGGGDSAFDEAEVLAAHAGSVTIVHNGKAPIAQRRTVDRVSALSNVHILAEAELTAIEGQGGVERVALRFADGTVSARDCEGVFVYVGLEPNGGFLGNLVERDAAGRIVTDIGLQTKHAGLFAAGDIRSGATAMLASVAGDGAAAAIAAIRHLHAYSEEKA